jgi:hypothetical protein
MPDRKSLRDSDGKIHNSMTAWKAYMKVHRHHPIVYVSGVHKGVEVPTARDEDRLMVEYMLELSREKREHVEETQHETWVVLRDGKLVDKQRDFTMEGWWMTAPKTEEG